MASGRDLQRNLVKVAEQYLKKGMKVYVEGQMQTRKWQDQSGKERYSTEIVLQKFRGELQMLDGRGEAARRRAAMPAAARGRISAVRPGRRQAAAIAAAAAVAAEAAAAARATSTTRSRSEATKPPRSEALPSPPLSRLSAC